MAKTEWVSEQFLIDRWNEWLNVVNPTEEDLERFRGSPQKGARVLYKYRWRYVKERYGDTRWRSWFWGAKRILQVNESSTLRVVTQKDSPSELDTNFAYTTFEEPEKFSVKVHIEAGTDYIESQHNLNPAQFDRAAHPRMVKRTFWVNKKTQKEYLGETFKDAMVLLAET